MLVCTSEDQSCFTCGSQHHSFEITAAAEITFTLVVKLTIGNHPIMTPHQESLDVNNASSVLSLSYESTVLMVSSVDMLDVLVEGDSIWTPADAAGS